MVPCHNCFIHEVWRSKELGRGEVLKSSYSGVGKSQLGGPNFMWGTDPSRHHVLTDCTLLSFKMQ